MLAPLIVKLEFDAVRITVYNIALSWNYVEIHDGRKMRANVSEKDYAKK